MNEKEDNKNPERVSIFIDGSNLYHNLKKYRIRIKFDELIKKIETKREIVSTFYYTALLDEKKDLKDTRNIINL